MDRPVVPGAPVRLTGAVPLWPVHTRRLPVSGGALRKLVDPALGHPRRPAWRTGRGGRSDAARLLQRRLFPGWPADHHWAFGQERHLDRTVRGGGGETRRRSAGRGDAGLAPPAATDPDDLAGVHGGRVSAGDRFG